MKKIILTAIVATGLLSASTQSGEELFKAKCAVCHKMGEPKEDPNAVAPMLVGVVTHLNEAFSDKEKLKSHIIDFVIKPTKEKAICKSVQRFGLMPSQEGAVSREEIAKIADFMAELKGMSKAEHNKMQGKDKKEKIFKMMDRDGDGVVSKDEFEKFREQRGKHQGNGIHKREDKGCAR